MAGELASTTTTLTLIVSLGITVQKELVQRPNFLVFLVHTLTGLTCLMPHNVTFVMKGNTVPVERQHHEVPVHLGFIVQKALVWLSSFLAPIVLIIQSLEGGDKTNVSTVLRATSVKKGLCSPHRVL